MKQIIASVFFGYCLILLGIYFSTLVLNFTFNFIKIGRETSYSFGVSYIKLGNNIFLTSFEF